MTAHLQQPHAGDGHVYHATVLSNFSRGYDKYAAAYDKAAIPASRFPDTFHVLDGGDLPLGLSKASVLAVKTGLPGDRPIVLRGSPPAGDLRPNTVTGTGIGLVIQGSRMPLDGVFIAEGDTLVPISVEDAYARSLALLTPELPAYASLAPRTLSVLPIARACQANCSFCFSETSVSADQIPHSIPDTDIRAMAIRAKAAGAERFVITGGGEPGLLPHAQLLSLMLVGDLYFGKTVLITNGIHLSRRPERTAGMIRDYVDAGLTVLSISRHHHDPVVNARIMGVDTRTESTLATLRDIRDQIPGLRVRLVCVIQRDGIETGDDIAAYLDWAAENGVDEVCFKELYVSTTLESVYAGHKENLWSRDHQVPLANVTSFLADAGFEIVAKLPWGSPVYAGDRDGRRITVAAYTEPSLYWERSNGIARSWNIMADGSCLASLEDPESRV